MAEVMLRYEKLALELTDLIRLGILRPGEKLPSIRRLAQEKRLSVATVVQALRGLEDQGLLEARPQSGYYVRWLPGSHRPPSTPAMPEVAVDVDVSQRLAAVMHAGTQPGVLPLAAALPSPLLLPIAPLNRLYAGVVRRHPHLLDGSDYFKASDPLLVRQLVRRSLAWGGPLAAEEIIVTHSCTEALSLCLRAVTRPGDTVAVESPAYYLMLQLLETLGLKALEIPTDPQHGMSVEALELATRHDQVKACLLVPNASNPLGGIMPDNKKRQLATLTAERGVAVIEDDIYGDLCFGPRRPWPIKAFDTRGNVMLCSSFSKSLSPALRVGFVAAGRQRAAIALLKTVSSGPTNPVAQRILAEYLASGAYDRHLRHLRRTYERQVEAMRAAIIRYFPAETRISRPQGAFVLWVELPAAIDASRLHASALAEKLTFVPGELFSPSGLYRHCLRLNCGHPHTPEIEAAIRDLGRLIARQ